MASVAKVIKMAGAIAGVQLNHAGSKAEMADENRIGTTMYYDYLPQETLSIITEEQIKEVEDKFIASAKRAKEAGFDFVEVHGAHGYLLNQFMHPQLNDVIKSDDIMVRGAIVLRIVKRIHDEVKIPVGITVDSKPLPRKSADLKIELVIFQMLLVPSMAANFSFIVSRVMPIRPAGFIVSIISLKTSSKASG